MITGYGKVRHAFFKTKGEKQLSDKAFAKAEEAIAKEFGADELLSACYIGMGVYHILCWNSLKTEVDPQDPKEMK